MVAKVNRSIRKAQGELEQEKAALAEKDRDTKNRAFKYGSKLQDLVVREQALQKREAKAKEAQAEAERREAEAQAEKEAAEAANAEARREWAEAMTEREAAEVVRKPLEAVAVALDAWAEGEIVDALETPEKGQELIYAETLLEERKQELDETIRPGFAAAFKIVASFVELARNAAEEALKRLRATATTQVRRLRL